MRRICAILAWLLWMASASCLAAEWSFSTSADSVDFYYDAESIVAYQDSRDERVRLIGCWIRREPGSAFVSLPAAYQISYIRINAGQQMAYTYEVVYLAADGAIVKRHIFPGTPERILPHTPLQRLARDIEAHV